MVIVNFKIVMGAEGDGGLLSLLTSALEGRAAATFVVLAGVGLGLARQGRMSLIAKRAVFLLAIGLLNMTVFDADILHYYAFYFLFGGLLLSFGNRVLVAAILGLNITFVALILTLDYDTGWNWQDYTYSGFWTPTGFVRNLLFNGWHPVIPWLSFLLFGIILGRLSLGARKTQVWLLVAGLGLLVCAEGLSVGLVAGFTQIDPDPAALATTAPVPPMPLYMFAGIGAACVVVGLCLLAADRLAAIGVTQIVAPAGRQTLTLYIAHILIGMGALEAMGLLGGQTVGQAICAALAFCAAATVYAFLWAKWFKRGPIEALIPRR